MDYEDDFKLTKNQQDLKWAFYCESELEKNEDIEAVLRSLLADISKQKPEEKETKAYYCVIMGLWDIKNNITEKYPLNVTGWRDVLITDIDYFVANRSYINSAVEAMILQRDSAKKVK